MSRIYCAGPMRSKVLYNFPAFDIAAQRLRECGWKVVSPAEMDMAAGFNPYDLPSDHDWSKEPDGMDFEEVMQRDMEALATCDSIFLLQGWRESEGAKREFDRACELGLHVSFQDTGYPVCHKQVTVGPMATSEVRIKNEKTGGEKGSKIERFDLIPAGPLTELARQYGVGCAKYADRNWEKGYDWSLSYASALRHLTQFWNGEDTDAETGTKHVIAAAWHCFALAEFMEKHPDLDNRPSESVELEYDEWGALPDSAQYVTRDPDGRRYWFSREPRIICGRWDEPEFDDSKWGTVPDTLTFPSVAKDIIEEWSDAIVERPEDWDRRIG